jgi:[ribosomal protein S5]-alanine N-acetyltransferase
MPYIPDSYFQQETERLKFRALTLEDIPLWVEFFHNNPNVRFVGVDAAKNQTHLDIATEWINRQLARYEEDGFGMLGAIEKETGDLIGMTGILSREIEGKQEKEIGYSYMPKTWGKGYATEAAMQMHQFGRENHLAERFISIIHLENFASMRVAEKNGMKPLFESKYMDMDVIVYGTELT